MRRDRSFDEGDDIRLTTCEIPARVCLGTALGDDGWVVFLSCAQLEVFLLSVLFSLP